MKKINLIWVLTLAISFASTKKLHAQACPACSNPALQSSEKLEAGSDTLDPGNLRITLNTTNGFNYKGGHPVDRVLILDYIVIFPLHNHNVDLDFMRTELSLEYTFKTNWTIWLRVPYDIKMQTASVDFIDAVTLEEEKAILRNRDIHHRTENYKGISDLRIFISKRINHFITDNARVDIAIGTSIPVGKTEADPLIAGLYSVSHLHIQFGSGTFDPLLELHYVTALSSKLAFSIFTMNKLPFYHNTKAYMAPKETTSGISFGYRVNHWLGLRGTLTSFIQSQATWNGLADPNSGLFAINSTLSPSFRLKNGLAISPGYRYPIFQKTLSDEGDGFTYGTTFVLNVSYLFDTKKP